MTNSKKYIVAVNFGSTSKKFSIFEQLNHHKLKLISKESIKIDNTKANSHQNIWTKLFNNQIPISKNITFGLRVVAPGLLFTKNQKINSPYIQKLKKIQSFSPLHVTPLLKEIKNIRKKFLKSKIYGISDSAFHKSNPSCAKHYAIATNTTKKHELYRYGYHGLANQSAIYQLKSQKLLKHRTIICHLGGGTSVTAIKNGKSIENSMGFSPIEGIMGVSRSGSLDPTIVNLLSKTNKNILDALYTQSGFIALTGSNNIKRIIEMSKTKNPNKNVNERDAVNLYCFQIQKAIGSLIAVLGGVDLIVFTGGIGVGSSYIRSKICRNFKFLNLNISPKINQQIISNTTLISNKNSQIKVAVLKVDEMHEIAKSCLHLISY